MTDRIRSLELEAIAYADSKVPAMDRYNDIYHSIVRGKFAELIVRECTNMLPEDSVRNADGVHMFYVIREHFGVSAIGR